MEHLRLEWISKFRSAGANNLDGHLEVALEEFLLFLLLLLLVRGQKDVEGLKTTTEVLNLVILPEVGVTELKVSARSIKVSNASIRSIPRNKPPEGRKNGT